jgi:hypothetical protein
MRRFDKHIPILSGLGDWARLRLILGGSNECPPATVSSYTVVVSHLAFGTPSLRSINALSVISLWHRGIRGGISFCLRHRLSWRVQASQHTAGHRRRKAITFLDLLRFLAFLIDNLFLNCACKSC